MKHIEKEHVPDFFHDFIIANHPENWNDLAPIRSQLRTYILENEQRNQCAYTELPLNAECSHIDHYKKQDLFHHLIFEYTNMLVSCNAEEYGAKYKDKCIKKDIAPYAGLVNPVADNPSDYLEFAYTGEVLAKNEKGQKTIEFFNLNHKSLVEKRKSIAVYIGNCKGYISAEEMFQEIRQFETMIYQLME